MKSHAVPAVRRIAAICTLLVAVAAVAQDAAADAAIDQQQPVINVDGGVFPVGGFYQQSLAQIVTAGRSGVLTEVRLPVYCAPSATFTVRIEGWTGSRPDGNVLASTSFPGSSLPFYSGFPNDVALRSFPLATPPPIAAGQQFAIVLAGGDCAVFPGPLGDPYSGGNAYYRDVDNPWSCLCLWPTLFGSDLPFATVVERRDTTAPTVSCTVSPATLKPPNHRLVSVDAVVTVDDTESGPAGFRLLSVTSNQADSDLDDEDVPGDIQGWALESADSSGELRAERFRQDRLYTLTYEGRDVAGNTATCTATVAVPRGV